MRTEIDSEKPWVRSRRDEGFSLVELMVAVGIMGSLSVMAIPAYGRYQVKAIQAEAKTTLSSIHTAQELYYTENQEYAGSKTAEDTAAAIKTAIGVGLSTDAKYGFPSSGGGLRPAGTPDGTKYRAIIEAKNKLAGCVTVTGKDKWCMDQAKEMTNKGVATQSTVCATGDSVDGGVGC